ncbi:hypothetical protein [Aureibacter tunicatorum]|uniref:Uncharacterized protein n=1 Tax=Aureibacter tunicatorum TaxID=866807 RepID=A0AAE4BTR3_9BACT|nr:hypothetical protein [Aureibacter tunicatorum]MDR6240971.1 hypothetical protein [Aureibacter tunicatorum]
MLLKNKKQLQQESEQAKLECLETLKKNLTVESLRILASKSGKKGINKKIKQFQHLI